MKRLASMLILLIALSSNAQVLTSVTNGLVGWWLPFGTNSSGTNVVDWSGQGNIGVTTNSPVWTNSITGTTNALNFTNIQVVGLSGSILPLLDGSNATITAWVFYQNFGNSVVPRIIDLNNNSSTNGIIFGLQSSGNAVFLQTINGSSNPLISAGNATFGNWQYLTAIVSNSVGFVFTNGVLAGTAALSTFGKDPTSSTIGNRINLIRGFSGSLSDVRTYSRVLTAAEIQRIYHEGQPWKTIQLGQPIGLNQRFSK